MLIISTFEKITAFLIRKIFNQVKNHFEKDIKFSCVCEESLKRFQYQLKIILKHSDT